MFSIYIGEMLKKQTAVRVMLSDVMTGDRADSPVLVFLSLIVLWMILGVYIS